MRHMMILCCLFSLVGCLRYEQWQLTKANRETQQEIQQIVRDQRRCLQERAMNPQLQHDCSVYNQTRYQVDVSGMK